MRFLYSLGLSLYALLLRLVAPFVPKAAAWVAGREGLLPRIGQALAADAAPRLWVHCASLGEFEQGRPLIEGLRQQYPTHKIVLTFFSPSGYEVRKGWPGADYVFYLPLDSAANAHEFVRLVQPRLAIFVKYEFWYYYLRELREQGVPAVVVAAIFRPSQIFFRPWGGFFRKILGQLSHIFTQNEASAELLRGIGLARVTVAGDTRFDTVAATALAPARPLPLAEAFVADGAPTLVAGSIWPEDLPALAPLLRKHARAMRFILAPHEVSEAHLQEIEAALPGLTVRYSRATPLAVADARLLLIDNVGMLSQLYRFGRFAYIGGAFGAGLHNTLEAAAFGLPVFFGPRYERFQEAIELVELGCAFSVASARQLESAFDRLYYNEEARLKVQDMSLEYVHTHAGATARILSQLRMKNEARRIISFDS
ncbi:3-deoxy-D-manno-octulosonic acid transferase [Hymenobacter sp. UV11]|uniref:3-deoxy-D-manno-octulosonic acid transferase n=1 Tax=Hymenobacter sp. UV11 TaxID=1849735 RepID=UPI00105DB807|nr:glycosyltransferase N-terminal domain-containing protein [Hymenobacter sp. UV11]TDN38556.1 3-deoxy-D-manno-octulosonic acid transferase [Hymenobacter sp. UV11]TFZ65239.1 3-deoxy-D-manno-octulosonic acid transferase [Hymenobacter sp. UV11]